MVATGVLIAPPGVNWKFVIDWVEFTPPVPPVKPIKAVVPPTWP